MKKNEIFLGRHPMKYFVPVLLFRGESHSDEEYPSSFYGPKLLLTEIKEGLFTNVFKMEGLLKTSSKLNDGYYDFKKILIIPKFNSLEEEEEYWYTLLKNKYEELGYSLPKSDKLKYQEYLEKGASNYHLYYWYLTVIKYYCPGTELFVPIADCLLFSVLNLNLDYYQYFSNISKNEKYSVSTESVQLLNKKYTRMIPGEIKLVNLTIEDKDLFLTMFPELNIKFDIQPYSHEKKLGLELSKKLDLNIVCKKLGMYYPFQMFLELVAWKLSKNGSSKLWEEYRTTPDLVVQKNIISEIITNTATSDEGIIYNINNCVLSAVTGAVASGREDYILNLIDAGLIRPEQRQKIVIEILNKNNPSLIELILTQLDFINAKVRIKHLKKEVVDTLTDDQIEQLFELSILQRR